MSLTAPETSNDGRRMALSRGNVRMHNESLVYNTLKSFNAPSSVSEISNAIPAITEKTVRRALVALRGNGFVVETGKNNGGAYTYQCADAMPTYDTGLNKRIPLGGIFVTVKDFVEVMANPNIDPFAASLKTELLTEAITLWLRRRFLFVIMTAGEIGFNDQKNSVREQLVKVRDEMTRLTKLVDAFTDSAVWHDHYRDGIAFDMRQLQKDDPALFQLAMDFMKADTQ